MNDATTLTELIEANRTRPHRITYLEGENQTREVSFAELYERSLGILYHLQRLGARRGDKLILFLTDNEQFIDAFWAAVLGGIVPVPVALGISDEHRMKLLRIARRLGKPFLYTERRSLERIGAFAAQAGEEEVYAALRERTFLVDDLDDISRAGSVQRSQAGDTAFIQFSSGSTSEPKGVVLTHGNILANCRGSTEVAGFGEHDVSLSWMPLTHDMGLIGFHLVMFANRVHAHLMPTELFIRRPLLWLGLASKVRATILCSPNFGYRHYLKVLGERAPEGLDLSAVRLIFNGAEPISVELCEEFLGRLAPAKLNRNAMYPVYGLAEASLAVSFPAVGAPLRTITLNRHRMSAGSPVELVPASDRHAVRLVSEGKPIPYCRVRIADDEDRELPEDRIGHVHMRGDNVTRGYYEDPEANAAAFTADGWLRTGDLGLVHGGELYISGRAKEIIFVNGQNYYPHDLEAIVQRVPGLELGKVVAAGVRAREAEIEQLVVFVLHRGTVADLLPTAKAVARLINEQTGLEVAEVVPVKRIPKTTSGKIQRHRLEEAYADGEFDAELAELAALREAARGPESGTLSRIEEKLKGICDVALAGKRIGIHDNLFEIGASSLKLIEIHEQIDREYPGQVDLTELFDFPTIAELARRLQGKLA
ncbi:MAG: AMP-dependent synthetase [Gammaproteobacteria bacterium]|nr:MAG: AMP-dependent synthetase [Gammaproteobacteria bacterium]TLZ14666.1 MAG: AMP-dependent synthetase [Gammaproteobacteria bacterium]TLZ16323.1 MAG: AMP-dependent synthetase [Gammaproteobacteria bacterium]